MIGPSRRSSHQDLGTSLQFVIPAGGEELGDLEGRGKELASRCWNDNEDFLPKEKVAEWIGGL